LNSLKESRIKLKLIIYLFLQNRIRIDKKGLLIYQKGTLVTQEIIYGILWYIRGTMDKDILFPQPTREKLQTCLLHLLKPVWWHRWQKIHCRPRCYHILQHH